MDVFGHTSCADTGHLLAIHEAHFGYVFPAAVEQTHNRALNGHQALRNYMQRGGVRLPGSSTSNSTLIIQILTTYLVLVDESSDHLLPRAFPAYQALKR